MKLLLLLSTALYGASAFPSVVSNNHMEEEPKDLATRSNPFVKISKEQTNCGTIPCKTFRAKEQLISVTGKYAWESPALTDIRGPCPGLNAAANHAYLPRTGLLTITDTVQGLSMLYGLSKEFNAFLAVYSIILTGDLVTMRWSIGGPMPYPNIGGVLYPPQGISYSHNKYEGDVSIGRADAYMNNGNAHSLNITRFQRAYAIGMDDDRYTLDKFRQAFVKNVFVSITENPYYFSPPFAGAAVPPAAYNFVINFMSNHTAEQPSGYLDGYTFKKFFAVRGEYPDFEWLPGQERIPDNWYRRPQDNAYGAITTVADVLIGAKAYPEGFRLGGNVGKPNTYTGIDLSKLTGGSITNGNVLKGNNLGCLIFLSAEQGIPDELKGGINDVSKALKIFGKFVKPITTKLGCAPLGKYEASVFEPFPGYHYNPTGNATNY